MVILIKGKPRFAAIWYKKSGPSPVARHNLSTSGYQSEFNKWMKKGYRLTHVSGYTDNGKPRYAAIWQKKERSGWTGRHNLSAKNYQSSFNNHLYTGYRLYKVSGFAVGKSAKFATIWHGGGFSGSDAKHINNTVSKFMKNTKCPV